MVDGPRAVSKMNGINRQLMRSDARMIRRFLLGSLCGLVAPLLSSCRSLEARRWPFPEVDAEVTAAAQRGDAGPVLAVLRNRVAGIESLYAELTMASEGGERRGVFDTIVYYHAPHSLRITAFRDLLVSTRDVFDLALSENRYVLRLDEGEERVHRGATSDLGSVGEGFDVFQLLGERVFLPGLVSDSESTMLEARDDGVSVTVSLAAGEVTWKADARTLGIRTATVKGTDGAARVEIEYLSYRRVGDVYLPERFRLVETSGGFSLYGLLRYVEVNPELDLEVLEEPFGE